MTARRTASLLAVILVVAACSDGDGSGADTTPATNDPGVTFGTVPPVDQPAPATGPADSVDVTPDASTGSEPGPAATTTLAPSPGADVPTAAPDELATEQPIEVPDGPLPIPTVALVEAGLFVAPIDVTTRPGDGRTFAVEQGGRIVAFDDLSSAVVLDITDRTEANGEQGLLGAAFHPERDLAYIHYNDDAGATVLAEYAIDPVTAVFDESTRRVVLTVDQPFPNHNGGQLAFGPDGFLYIGLGDGGAANDPDRVALSLASPLGKILRIDPLEAGDDPFTVPAGNPFADVADADPRIWSLGLRNPWKFSFDELTGDLWIADVGQNAFEEIDLAPATTGLNAGRGVSFGWSAFEGDERFNADQSPEGHTPPVLTYPHGDGNCSVSGGVLYRGERVADLAGWYVFGDFCSGRIWGYDPTSGSIDPVVVDLGQLDGLAAVALGSEGELYAVSNGGTINRFVSG